MVYENEIAVTWTLVIGISAIISSYLLLNKKTKHWSEEKIAFLSVLISFCIILLLGMISKLGR